MGLGGEGWFMEGTKRWVVWKGGEEVRVGCECALVVNSVVFVGDEVMAVEDG